MTRFRLGVDVGGTFTDLVALAEDGSLRVAKVASSHPEPAEAILEGVARLVGPGETIVETVLGTTAGLNALLERRGAATALITNAGFGDVYRLARGDRPAIYDLHYHRPLPLVDACDVFEIGGRIDASGAVVAPLDGERADEIARQLARRPYESVAICLLHSYRNPAHELELEGRLRAGAPACAISLSHRVAREWREYERSSTTVIDAYVRPILERHLDRLRAGLERAGHSPAIFVMRSSGGLMPGDAHPIEPATVLLSGPVGGALAAAALGRRMGLGDALAVDMGGTSFDVTLLDGGDLPISDESAIEGFPLLVASVPIDTIGAGGGSVVWLEGEGLRVGPRSAGATPGPVCFGRGGSEPTVTDANACLGRIRAGRFVGGRLPLDVAAAAAAFEPIAGRLDITPERLHEGVVEIVDARMVAAIRAITVERGLDARHFTLIAYGGNGPLHAASLAESLGIDRIVVPPSPGAFSACGMLFGEIRKDLSMTFLRSSDELTASDLEVPMAGLCRLANAFLEASGLPTDTARFVWRSAMRYRGQEHSVLVPLPPPPSGDDALAAAFGTFHDLHERRYGHAHPMQPVEIVAIRLGVLGPPNAATLRLPDDPATPSDGATRPVRWRGATMTIPVHGRDALLGSAFDGPCVIDEATATTLVPPGWTVTVDAASASLVLRRGAA